MFNKSIYLSIKYVVSLIQFSKSIPDYINILDSTYRGLDNTYLPLKIIKGKMNLKRTIILYPGASPFAEEHPSMIFLGSVLANTGFNVYIPRIPLLKDLDISEKNVEWFQNAYNQLLNRDDIKNTIVSCMGVSYGGAILLKSSLGGKMFTQSPPRSIITYGTIYDVHNSLDFVMTGKIKIKGKEVKIKPHEWGLVVCFHNFLNSIDIGYDTLKIQKILKLRVQNKHKEVKSEIDQLYEGDRVLINDILNSNISPEVKRIIDIILKEKIDVLDGISPQNWCHNVKSKVFIMHGANDNMVPYTQSVLLSKHIKNSELFISYLYEHNEIAPKRSIFYKLIELKRLVFFIRKFIKHHED